MIWEEHILNHYDSRRREVHKDAEDLDHNLVEAAQIANLSLPLLVKTLKEFEEKGFNTVSILTEEGTIRVHKTQYETLDEYKEREWNNLRARVDIIRRSIVNNTTRLKVLSDQVDEFNKVGLDIYHPTSVTEFIEKNNNA